MKVLVVDDSIVFRTQISSSLKGIDGVEVVGSASNGKIALEKLEQLSVDLITLDMEMPEMNGMETLREIKKRGLKTKVIIFSSQTVRGAEKALEALSEGADDVVAKPSGEELNFENAGDAVRAALIPKVMQFMRPVVTDVAPKITHIAPVVNKDLPKIKLTQFSPSIGVIASSTGGPTALESIFSNLKGHTLKKPLLIVQHMPPVFTQILAKRLTDISGLDVREAKDGEAIVPGRVYIAPGDFHMLLRRADKDTIIQLNQNAQRNSVRPAADYLFETAAELFSKNCFGVVLTGMGEDGALGAKRVRQAGGAVMIQNKESCIVFGMPGAVFANNDYDEIGDLAQISERVKLLLMGL